MTESNPYIGTFKAKIGDDEYTLRPSFEACVKFEKVSGITIVNAYKQMSDAPGWTIIGIAVWAGIFGEWYAMQSSPTEPSLEVIGENVKRMGLVKGIDIAKKFLTYAIIPHEDMIQSMKDEEDIKKKLAQEENIQSTGGDSSEN